MVAVHPRGESRQRVAARLAELEGLIEAAGATVIGRLSQARDQVERGLGQGALVELTQLVHQHSADLVVFDDELFPSVVARVEETLGKGVRVVDRTQVILDIFSRRARSKEGRVQVELAQYRYLEPRLKGRVGLTRQGGGIGTRGPGETRLELDRRYVRRRIRDLSQQLADIERERQGRRLRRQRTELPLVALVGYTNVGKSTLYQTLTHRRQTSEDALFVTLDPTVRRFLVPRFGPVLLADTVGFVDRLPHGLVAAFRSTLDEVRDADLVVEVLSGDPAFPVGLEEQQRVVEETLRALGADAAMRIRVYSQSDRALASERQGWHEGVAVSALTGEGVTTLLEHLSNRLQTLYRQAWVEVPWGEARWWKVIYAEFVVLEHHAYPEHARVLLRGPERAFSLLARLQNSSVG